MKLMLRNPQLANKAFHAFNKKVEQRIYAVCAKLCSRSDYTNNREARKDLCQETMIEFYRIIFRFDETKYPDEQSLLSGIMFWVIKIAVRKYSDIIKSFIAFEKYSKLLLSNYYHRNKGSSSQETDEKFFFVKEKDKKYVRINVEQFLQILGSLPERERAILMTYMLYRDYPSSKPPRIVIRNLAQQYGIKVNSVRAIKKRAFDSIRKKVLDLISKKCYDCRD
ncbi:MAG: sigma-70 family RNA polymerase sigma factor [Bacteroidia bacterium]|nr:sigma-70 family RNA polymerase sigma factor [Bacteroidia bacterium]